MNEKLIEAGLEGNFYITPDMDQAAIDEMVDSAEERIQGKIESDAAAVADKNQQSLNVLAKSGWDSMDFSKGIKDAESKDIAKFIASTQLTSRKDENTVGAGTNFSKEELFNNWNAIQQKLDDEIKAANEAKVKALEEGNEE
jgi:phage pi2 protein 07